MIVLMGTVIAILTSLSTSAISTNGEIGSTSLTWSHFPRGCFQFVGPAYDSTAEVQSFGVNYRPRLFDESKDISVGYCQKPNFGTMDHFFKNR